MEKWRLVRDSFKQSGLKKTLLEVMLWNLPGNNKVSVAVDGEAVEVEVLAELPGAAFLQVPTSSRDASRWFRQVDKELSKRFPERIVRFQHASGDSWFWPKKLSSGSLSYERLVTKNNDIPDYLAQRLAGLSFTQRDHNTLGVINPISVREKIRGQFESSKVTSDFFKKFRAKHELLTSQIVGIEDQSEASSYSTLILNRLMFIYFLQKKEFLNGDPNYLKTCLSKVRKLRGEDKFYSFYKDYLLELFFNKLDNPSGKIEDPAIHEIAGDIPYVNGGVFSRSPAEEKFEIEIPDSAFEEIFSFFDSYTWHLDTRPTGTANEINPEVIGYIFEQYINFTAGGKKENGAYYTSHDVTGYMVGQTLIPRILDEVLDLGIDIFDLLPGNADAYIFESLKHGWDTAIGDWKPIEPNLELCWEGDPIGWSLLDNTETDKQVCLPDETWVEAFARRERVDSLRRQIQTGQASEVNDLISLNLNCEKLLADAIYSCESADLLEKLWDSVGRLRVLDPTCGSGAFLFAALEILEVVYAALADRLEELNPGSGPVAALQSHGNRRYFLRKHASMRNLYGTDIMEDAIETAKLRIFLALASCLESRSELEPLPDLDFNLKVGNLLVGFESVGDVARVSEGMLIFDNRLVGLQADISSYESDYKEFQKKSLENSEGLQNLKSDLLSQQERLRVLADEFYAECTGQSEGEYRVWADSLKPLHWLIEFPEAMDAGGFDVILGNPPYMARSSMSAQEVSSLIGYETSDFRDIYAVCYERSVRLLAKSGRHAFIVMLSLSFGDTYKSLRTFLRRAKRDEWWATFGRWPDGLFTGARVRNTILTMGPGRGSSHTTQHNIITARTKPWVFQNLEFSEAEVHGSAAPIRGGIAQDLATSIHKCPRTPEVGEAVVFVRPTASYWFPALYENPPVLDMNLSVIRAEDNGTMAVHLPMGFTSTFGGSVLGTKLAYLYWQAIGDDFHVNAREIHPILSFVKSAAGSTELDSLGTKLRDASENAMFFSNNAKACYLSIRWNSLRAASDEFERELLLKTGPPGSWRSLNIWYRRTMRSTRENMNSTNLTREQFKGIQKKS
jgi:hypothetical protein